MAALHDDDYRAFIAMFVEERQRAGLTQRDLAQRVGLHHSIVGKVETCERRLDVVELLRFLRALDVDARKFVAALETRLGS